MNYSWACFSEQKLYLKEFLVKEVVSYIMKCYKSPEWFQVTNPTLGIGKSVPGTARTKYRGPDLKHVEVNDFFPLSAVDIRLFNFMGRKKFILWNKHAQRNTTHSSNTCACFLTVFNGKHVCTVRWAHWITQLFEGN